MNLVSNPIVDSVQPQKQSVRRHFGSHPYFTRRPWNVVQAYVKHFAPDKEHLVLDPFGGSGVTAIESIVLGRHAIHVDINPLANFICSQIAVAPVDIHSLQNAFLKLESICRPYIQRIFSEPPEEVARERFLAWYPSGIPLPKNADAPNIEDLFTRRQLLSLSMLYQNICEIGDAAQRDLLRFAFSATLNKCNLTYSTTKGRSEGRGNSGIMHTYRYWIPKEPVELNVWNEFNHKFKNLLAAKRETNIAIGNNYQRLRVIRGSATKLTDFISEESVDYVFTDPPYGSHIAYLDLSTMWNAWLGFDVELEDKESEVIEGGDLGKSLDDYARLLGDSLREMHEVLRWDAWASIVFAHKDLSYWSVLIEAAQEAGFEYKNTVVQQTFQSSRHKRANPRSVLSGELILNMQKKRRPKRIKIKDYASPSNEVLRETVDELLKTNEYGLFTEDIYNQLIPRLLEMGMLNGGRKNNLAELGDILKEDFYLDESSERWYKSKMAAKSGRKALALKEQKGQLPLEI